MIIIIINGRKTFKKTRKQMKKKQAKNKTC